LQICPYVEMYVLESDSVRVTDEPFRTPISLIHHVLLLLIKPAAISYARGVEGQMDP